MALPPTLKAFRDRLEDIGFKDRTIYQDKLVKELNALDEATRAEVIEEAAFSVTKMTSPGNGCPCCGR